MAVPVVGYGAFRQICRNVGDAAVNTATLDGIVKSPEHALRIGRAYVEARYGDIGIPALLWEDSCIAGALGLGCAESGIGQLADLIRQDFAIARVEVVEQWVLSKTELLICAIFYSHSIGRI